MEERRDLTRLRFEDGMATLEGLVARLESGDLALEEALEAFEEGVTLVKVLNQRLTEAERRIEILSRGQDGSLSLRVAGEEDQ